MSNFPQNDNELYLNFNFNNPEEQSPLINNNSMNILNILHNNNIQANVPNSFLISPSPNSQNYINQQPFNYPLVPNNNNNGGTSFIVDDDLLGWVASPGNYTSSTSPDLEELDKFNNFQLFFDSDEPVEFQFDTTYDDIKHLQNDPQLDFSLFAGDDCMNLEGWNMADSNEIDTHALLEVKQENASPLNFMQQQVLENNNSNTSNSNQQILLPIRASDSTDNNANSTNNVNINTCNNTNNTGRRTKKNTTRKPPKKQVAPSSSNITPSMSPLVRIESEESSTNLVNGNNATPLTHLLEMSEELLKEYVTNLMKTKYNYTSEINFEEEEFYKLFQSKEKIQALHNKSIVENEKIKSNVLSQYCSQIGLLQPTNNPDLSSSSIDWGVMCQYSGELSALSDKIKKKVEIKNKDNLVLYEQTFERLLNDWVYRVRNPVTFEIVESTEPTTSSSNGASSSNATQKTSSKGKKKQRSTNRRLPPEAKKVLENWFLEHWTNPYPSNQEKEDLCEQTQLTLTQINNWFINKRGRSLKSVKEKLKSETTKEEGKQADINHKERK
ncbi:hypothetical protein ABK040_014955 [Willaertia magna]